MQPQAATGACYKSYADKRERWPRVTLPAIFAAARHAFNDVGERNALRRWMQGHGISTAEQLHEAARKGRYVPTPDPLRHCDPIQPVNFTARHGGDCDQWAAVLLAGLRCLGFENMFLVATGDETDPYRHACAVVEHRGRYYRLDPKADQQGAAFNERADDYPRETFYRLAWSL